MIEELDEARAVAELTAASIMDRLYPELVKMIADSLIAEIEIEKLSQVKKFFDKKVTKKSKKTAIDYLKDVILQNPNSSEDQLRHIFCNLDVNLNKTKDTNRTAFRRSLEKIRGQNA